MLSPGDVVFIDVPREQITLATPRWTVTEASRRGDLHSAEATNFYTLQCGEEILRNVTPDRITAHLTYNVVQH